MSEIINFSEQSYKRTINFDAKFLLVGNNIDGWVDIDFVEFDNFEDLKSKFSNLICNINCTGEWDLKLYEVPNSYILIKKFGYYKEPEQGALIFEHNYMSYPIKKVIFLENKIQFVGLLFDTTENWHDETNDFLNIEIDVDIINLYLLKPTEKKRFTIFVK